MKKVRKLWDHAVLLAVGSLLATVGLLIFHEIEHSLESGEFIEVGIILLLSILGIFWGLKMPRHDACCGKDYPEINRDVNITLSLILLGGLIHSLMDGTLISGAFSESRSLGLIALAAVGTHEIFRLSVLFSIFRPLKGKVVSGLLVLILVLSIALGFQLAAFGIAIGGFWPSALVSAVFLATAVHMLMWVKAKNQIDYKLSWIALGFIITTLMEFLIH